MLSRAVKSPRIFNSLFVRSGLQNSCIRLTSTKSDAVEQKPVTELTYEAQKAHLLELLKKELPKPYDGPERDLVNFPRRVRKEYPDVIRHGFIPQDWLDFFYKKTGVTGPYFFGFGLVTFLLSKELYVWEEETSTGIALFIIVYTCFKKFGPKVRAYSQKLMDEEIEKNDSVKRENMERLENAIAEEKKQQWYTGATKVLIEAKRENVQIQLETEYRRRMMDVYEQVKKRLDYFFDMDSTRRKLEQKYMADWIVQNVMKSITPQQEKEALQKCISDLKVLSAQSA